MQVYKLHRLPPYVLAILTTLLLVFTSTLQAGEEEFLPVDEAFHLTASREGGDIVLRWDIADGYYLYRHRLNIEGESSSIAGPALPEGELITDEFFGESQVYYDSVEVRLDPQEAQRLELSWQGCAKAGLCYPPQRQTVTLADLSGNTNQSTAASLPDSLSSSQSAPSAAAVNDSMADDQRLAASLASSNTLWTLAAFFGMGLLLTFTPCVLPMVPILSSLIIGGSRQPGRGLLLSLAFVIPMALTYALLGVAAALAGANLQMLFQNPVFIGIFAGLFVALAMAMFGLFEMELPAFLRHRLDRLQQQQQGGRMASAAIMGALSALLVGPCMTAPLAGALLYIADSGDVLQGGLALLFLGLGMGAPLLLVGLIGPRLLPRPGPWMIKVRILFGFVMLGMAIWFAERILPTPVMLGLWGVLAIGFALALWHVAAKTALPSRALISRSMALVIGLWGMVWIIGAAGGSQDLRQPLRFLQGNATNAQAAETATLEFKEVETLEKLQDSIQQASARGEWTMVDFTADWCISCKVIEREVFGDADVQQALNDVTRLQPDVTDNSANDREIMKAFGILGPPTIMLFGPDGEERRGQRIIGELNAEEFLANLEHAGLMPDSQTSTKEEQNP
ncbi:protein-disulfide reductase DsbD [Halomonas korlensis]|uniref:Thiol:disulfide interchange protein DsbD n=1 Tax=Halomonas korlensis TaxID=463301 RepID=A0A1I7IC87_9GAMM|nr:protein-disulfide reductase DsbD [Halomonas korlensis]SFU70488.1 thiol:disulfide interchange protein DsbD [Halomonas korlensis]